MTTGPRDKPYPIVLHIDSITGKPIRLAESSSVYLDSLSSVTVSAISISATNWYGLPAGQVAYVSSLGDVSPDLVSQLETGKSLVWSGTEWIASSIGGDSANLTELSSTVTGHIADSDIHFTSGSLSSYYAASSWVDANYSPTGHVHDQYALTSTLDELSSTVTGHIADSTIHFTADSLTGTYATTASLNDYVLTSINNALSTAVTDHITSASVHFTSGSLSGYYAASSWVDANYATTGHIHSQYALTSTVNDLNSTVTGHIADSTIHFTADSLTGTYATTAALGSYVLTSTNSNLSSLVYSIEASTVDLSAYIEANEIGWVGGGVTSHGDLANLNANDHPQYVLSTTNLTLSNTVTGHIADSTIHFTADSLTGTYATTASLGNYVLTSTNSNLSSLVSNLESTTNLVTGVLVGHIGDSSLHFTADSLTGTYATTASLGNYVLTSTNTSLSSLVYSIEASTVDLSAYIEANETSWLTGLTLPNQPCGVLFVAADGISLSANPGIIIDNTISALEVYSNAADNTGGIDLYPNGNLEGFVRWDPDYHTLGIQGENDTRINLGVDEIIPVYNDTGNTVYKGQIVWVSGAQGGVFRGRIALLSTATEDPFIIGACLKDIATESNGYIIKKGLIKNAKKTDVFVTGLTLAAGEVLYVSDQPGKLTNIAPGPGIHTIQFGLFLQESGGNCSYGVLINKGYDLLDLHDVEASPNQSGQTIVWDTTAGYFVTGDHGSLAGLGDNDHPQYVLSATNLSLSNTVTGHIADSTIHFTAGSLTSTYATTASLGNYVLTSTNNNLSTTVADHIASASVHFTSGSLSGYYAASSWVDANYAPISHSHNQYALTSTLNELSSTVTGHIADSTIHFTADSLTGTYATTASLGNYVLTSTNSTLSSTVVDHITSASVHFTSGSLSGYYAASSWVDANYTPLTLTSTFETTANAAATYATIASLNNYVLTSTNNNLSTTVNNHISDSTIHFTADSLTGTYATTAALGNYVLTSTNSTLSSTVVDHITSASVHFTSGSLSGYYAASSWVDANYTPLTLTSTFETTAYSRSNFLTGIADNYITSNMLQDNSVIGSKIAATSVDLTKIAFTDDTAFGNDYILIARGGSFYSIDGEKSQYLTYDGEGNLLFEEIAVGFNITPPAEFTSPSTTYYSSIVVNELSSNYHLGVSSYIENLTVTSHNISLSSLTDVSSGAAASGQVLKYNGSVWAPAVDKTTSPAGEQEGAIQFNSGGLFGADDSLYYVTGTSTLISPTLSATTYLNLPSGTATWNASALAGKPIDTGSWPEAGTGPGVAFYSNTEDKFLTIRLNSSVLNGTRDVFNGPNQGYLVASYLASANDTYFGINPYWNNIDGLGTKDLPANKDVLVYNNNLYGFGLIGWTWEQLSLSGGYLLDVSSVAPTADKQVLSFDSTTSKWKPAPAIVEIGIACSDETTDLVSGTAKATFRLPYAMYLTEVRANVNTAPSGSTIIVDINKNGSTLLSTKLSIDANEKTSKTAATPAVISSNTLADDDEITIDIDQIGSTTAGKGLKVWLIGNRL